jgi:hypothetical protein
MIHTPMTPFLLGSLFACFSHHVSNAIPFVFVTHATCLCNRSNNSKFKNSVFLGYADVSSEQILRLERTVVPVKARNQCHIKEDLNPQKQFCENLKSNTLLVSHICYFLKCSI